MKIPLSKKQLLSGFTGLIAIVAGVLVAMVWSSTDRIELSGLVQAKEVRNASRFGGRVEKILVHEGDIVKAGQPLILFETIDLQSQIFEAQSAVNQAVSREKLLAQGADAAQIRQAAAQVQQAQERLNMLVRGGRPEEIAQAKSKLDAAKTVSDNTAQLLRNAKSMLDEGIISQQKYDELRSQQEAVKSTYETAQANFKLLKNGARPEEVGIARSQLAAARAQYDAVRRGAKHEELNIAESGVKQAESALTALESQQDEVRLTAPISGQVTTVAVNAGELVPPGRPVISILDTGNLWTDIFVPESKLQFVQVGKEVAVETPALKKASFQGKVVLINPKSEFVPTGSGSSTSEESTFRVKVVMNPRDRSGKNQLFPGMRVNVILNR